VRGTPLELVERFAIAGSLQEHPDDAACQTTIFASGERRIERGSKCRPIICGAPRFWTMRRRFFAARF
jgi:hypothetical protein